MGFKSKATKANKEKKQDRKPIQRQARGTTWNGYSTHRKFETDSWNEMTISEDYREQGIRFLSLETLEEFGDEKPRSS